MQRSICLVPRSPAWPKAVIRSIHPATSMPTRPHDHSLVYAHVTTRASGAGCMVHWQRCRAMVRCDAEAPRVAYSTRSAIGEAMLRGHDSASKLTRRHGNADRPPRIRAGDAAPKQCHHRQAGMALMRRWDDMPRHCCFVWATPDRGFTP
jgi:hypothetical protein